MPLLGICRGAQALNVACGGTLHQHLPGHRQSEPGTQTTHDGRDRSPRTRLAGLLGAGTLAVNSFHHQAVDRLGERPARRRPRRRRHGRGDRGPGGFVLGVQWHAETLADGAAVRGARRAPPRRALRIAAPESSASPRVRTPACAILGVVPERPPSACAASSSASGRSPRSTGSTSTCPRAPASACSGPTARASRRR